MLDSTGRDSEKSSVLGLCGKVVVKTMVRQAVTLQPMEVHGGPWWSRRPPAARGGPHARAGGCLKEAVTPRRACPGRTCGLMERGAHAGAGLLAGLVTL